MHYLGKWSLLLAAGAMAATSQLSFAQDQTPPEDEEHAMESIIVTSTRIRQGGVQDIKQFRSVSLDGSFLPKPDTLTVEGLLGEYDLSLPVLEGCAQTFCIAGHAMSANLPLRPEDKYFVGLGFGSNVDADALKQEPLTLVAVADRSGSMDGEPIERLRDGLLEVLARLRDEDRFGLVSFETTAQTELPVMEVGPNRERIAKAIRGLESAGSTNMEAGLKIGYDLALADKRQTGRKSRVMLLTDEHPNVGNTAPDGFMGMAVANSKQGVGLTTIGVGIHFDNALALEISSMRGGNLFYLASDGDARDLFRREFYNMVTEVAHDVAITMTPADGYKVNAVFGVPNDLLTQAPDGAITVRIGSAFLSENAGGIFATLGRDSSREFLPEATVPDGKALLEVSIDYTDALSERRGSAKASVGMPGGTPPANLATAEMLVDEYLSLTKALTAYHEENNRDEAYRLIDGFSKRLAAAPDRRLDEERKMVRGLRQRAAYLAGLSSELPDEMRPLAVIGRWEVTSQRGLKDIARGDIVEITSDNELITYRKSGRQAGTEITQTFQVNENQFYIDYTDLVFQYRVRGDRLTMSTLGDELRLNLKKIES